MKWFEKLTSQEQKLIKVGLIILLPVIMWKFIYLPITQSYQTKQSQLVTLVNQYKEMQLSKSALKGALKVQEATNKNFHRNINKPFVAWIDEQLTKNGLAQFVVRSEPKDNQTLILTFESVVFDELVTWLAPLEQNYSIKISEVDINLTDIDNGLCNARITLVEN